VPTRIVRLEEQEDYEFEKKLLNKKFNYVTINGRRRKIATDKVMIKKKLSDDKFYVFVEAGYSHSMALTSNFLNRLFITLKRMDNYMPWV